MEEEKKYASIKFIIVLLRLMVALLAVLILPKGVGVDLVGWIISEEWSDWMGLIALGLFFLLWLLEFLLKKYG